MVLLLVDRYQIISLVDSVLLLSSRLHDLPTQLTWSLLALYSKSPLIAADFGEDTKPGVTVELAFFGVGSFFESDGDGVVGEGRISGFCVVGFE